MNRYRAEFAEHPIGDPFGGPAAGKREDITGGLLTAGASIVGGLLSNDASNNAAGAQLEGVNSANALSDRQYQQTRSDYSPYLRTGTAANDILAHYLGIQTQDNANPFNSAEANSEVTRLMGLNGGDRNAAINQVAAGWGLTPNQTGANTAGFGSLLKSFDANDLSSDPIYQATYGTALRTGTQQLNRLAAANGTLNSGAQAKALARFGADTQSTYANDAYNRYNTNQGNQYNRLAGLSGAGQQAVGAVSAAGQQNAATVGNNLIGAGNARAASSVAGGNALSGALNSIPNYYNTQNILSRLGGGPQSSGSPTIYGNNDLSQSLSGFLMNGLK
ncbi:hypothetical protein [Herbaspirillum aquaticum]|uniref:DNA transfer protein n=1 Tax=Herbaspirillum aquaticum TaxID=568783 RepID=A0A225SQ32_9BURK|nr:hypothetical protein [Herbaspirillum aquaticum]OWY32865.1 hypothetical protein CEJ45_19405 [Herbaspirillum aquaticum]